MIKTKINNCVVLAALVAALFFFGPARAEDFAPAVSPTPVVTATIAPPKKLDLKSELALVTAKGPVHLRTRKSPLENVSAVLFSFIPENGGSVSLRILNAQGDDVLYAQEALSASEFINTILSPSSEFKFKSKGASYRVRVENPLARNALERSSVALSCKLSILPESKIGISGTVDVYLDVLVMSHNVLNYWDGNPSNTAEDRMYGYDEFTQMFSNWYDDRIKNAKARSVVKVLRLAGLPDVVALQELEWASGLSEVFVAGSPLRTALEELGYKSFLLGKQDAKNRVSITTGFLSRYPLVDLPAIPFNSSDAAFARFSERERRSVSHSTRDIQNVELQIGTHRLRALNTHWRSKGCSGEESCELSERVRLANAEVMSREIVSLRRTNPEVEVIILGDFNSSHEDKALEKMGSTGDKESVAKGKQAQSFYNLWYDLPKDLRWEHEFAGTRSTLAQILIAQPLFDTAGFEYVDGSFAALGHSGVARQVLMNPNDTPLRWQESRLRFEEAPASKREGMQAAFALRGCSSEKERKKRKCKEAFTEHTGVGFSDHLPLTARLSFTGDADAVIFEIDKSPNRKMEFSDTPRCKNSEAVALDGLEFWKPEHLGRCVFWRPAVPQPLRNRGVYEFGFVVFKENAIGLTMNGAYNPNSNNQVTVKADEGKLGDGTPMSPASDMCFARNVLQHEGGLVEKVLGRLGFDNGLPTIFIHSRDDIELDDLPEDKAKACR